MGISTHARRELRARLAAAHLPAPHGSAHISVARCGYRGDLCRTVHMLDTVTSVPVAN